MGGRSSKPPESNIDLGPTEDNLSHEKHHVDPGPAKNHVEHKKPAEDFDEDDRKFAGDQIELKSFRPPQSVHGNKRQHLAMTLKGTVRARRARIGAEAATSHDPELLDNIRLPTGQLAQDWIAVNTIHFYNMVSVIYGSLSTCTDSSCPIMSAGSQFQYLWAPPRSSDDPGPPSQPVQLTAPQYMQVVFDWIDAMISNPDIFPILSDNYPPDFTFHCNSIYKRIFRIYAHIYYSHFDDIRAGNAEFQLNSSFQHFAMFGCEFGLLHSEDMRPLNRLLDKLIPGFSDKAQANSEPAKQ